MVKRKNLILRFWICLLASMVFAVPLWGTEENLENSADDLNLPVVVARINGTEITSKFIRFRINSVLSAMKRQAGSMPMGLNKVKKIKIARNIIDKEVIRELMYQEAKNADIKVSTEFLDEEMDKLKKAMGGEEKFKKSLKKRDLNPEILRHDMEMEFYIRDLIKERIEGNITITDEEVKIFYDANLEKFKRPESFHTRHILIPHFSREDLESVEKKDMAETQKELSVRSKKKAEDILVKIRRGGDFKALAKTYSKDAGSAKKGGDLNFMYKGIFPKEFDEAVAKLKPQEISDVVTTVAGHHIIQLIETRPPDTALFKDVKEEIQKFLFMQNGKKRLENYVEKLRKRAKVEVLY